MRRFQTEASEAFSTTDTTAAPERWPGRSTRVEAEASRSPRRRDPATSGGQPLPSSVRGELEGALGSSLADVRVHTGVASQRAAGDLGARAFTVGQDIHFGLEPFDDASTAGRTLLAHEVAHTVQQRGQVASAQTKLAVSGAGDSHETEADVFATAFVSGHVAAAERPRLGSAGLRVSRWGPTHLPAQDPDHLLLTRLHHDGVGGWSNADGTPLPVSELPRLRRALAHSAAAAGPSSPELARYRAFIASARNPALDPISWRQRERAPATPTPGAGPAAPGLIDHVDGPGEMPDSSDPERQAARSENLHEVPERTLGLDTPVEDADGQPVRRIASGTTRGAPAGPLHDRQAGGRDYSTETDPDGTERRIEQVDQQRRRIGPGALSTEDVQGRRVEQLDGQAMANTLRARLQARQRDITAQRRNASPDTRLALDVEERNLREDLAALASPGRDFDPAEVDRIAQRHQLAIDPERRVVEADMTTRRRDVDLNPLDGTLGTNRETITETVTPAGSTVRRDASNTELDLGEGRLARTRENSVARTRPAAGNPDQDETVRNTARTTGAAQLGNGGVNLSARRDDEVVVEQDGELQQRTTNTGQVQAGAVLDDNEVGARGGVTARREVETPEGTTTTEGSLNGTVTDRQLAGRAQVSGSRRRGSLEVNGRAAVDGSFTIDIEALDDGRYRLTFHTHVGVGGQVGGSAGREDGTGAQAALEVNAGARADLINTRVLTAEEAQGYLDAADAADRGEAPHQPAEFGSLARLRAATGEAAVLRQSMAAVNDPSAARNMRDGDSVTLDTAASAGVNTSLGASGGEGGASVEGEASRELRRTVLVERIDSDGAPRVRITVTYAQADHLRGEANLSIGGTGAGMGALRDDSSSDMVQFLLDPAAPHYDDRYRAIVGTTDREALRALSRRPDMRALVRRDARNSASTEGEDYENTQGRAGIRVGVRRNGSETVTTVRDDAGNPVHLEGDISGGNSSDMAATFDGDDYGSVSDDEQLAARVGPNGVTAELTQTEGGSDVPRALREAGQELADGDARSRAAQVMAHSPTEHLQELFHTFEHQWGYHLSSDDLQTLAHRAQDTRKWRRCCHNLRALEAWTRAGQALAHPRPIPAEDAINHSDAVNLSRARALATFMQNADGEGYDTLANALRHYGEAAGVQGFHESTERRLGVGYEWPEDLDTAHQRYSAACADAGRLPARFEALLDAADGLDRAVPIFESVRNDLDWVLREVRRSQDFRDAEQRSELLRELEDKRGDVYLRHRDFERRWNQRHRPGAPTTPLDPEAARARDLADEHAFGTAQSRARVRALIRTLRDNHQREAELMEQGRVATPEGEPGYTFGGAGDAIHIYSDVHNLHRTWIQQILDLRRLYQEAGIAESEWEVSAGPHASRHRDLEPNIRWLCNAFTRASRFNGAMDYSGNTTRVWLSQADY